MKTRRIATFIILKDNRIVVRSKEIKLSNFAFQIDAPSSKHSWKVTSVLKRRQQSHGKVTSRHNKLYKEARLESSPQERYQENERILISLLQTKLRSITLLFTHGIKPRIFEFRTTFDSLTPISPFHHRTKGQRRELSQFQLETRGSLHDKVLFNFPSSFLHCKARNETALPRLFPTSF